MKQVLFINVFIKCLICFALLLFSYNGTAQDFTFNTGGNNGKLYCRSNSSFYVANIISSKDNTIAKDVMADKITMFFSSKDNSPFDTDFTWISSYGNFLEFIDYYYERPAPVFLNRSLDAIVQNGNTLYLVSFYNPDSPLEFRERMIGTITTELYDKGDDFQIHYWKDTIFIINNGIVNVYKISTIEKTSSVKSPEAEKSKSKIYSIDGKQIQSPQGSGVYIKGGKKVVISATK